MDKADLDHLLADIDEAHRRMDQAIPIDAKPYDEQNPPPAPTLDEWRDFAAASREMGQLLERFTRDFHSM